MQSIRLPEAVGNGEPMPRDTRIMSDVQRAVCAQCGAWYTFRVSNHAYWELNYCSHQCSRRSR